MADQFDIVDIVYNAVEPASTGFILYKDQSGDGEKRNHNTIRSLALNGKDYVNKGSININIFVKRPSKGVSDRQLMIETVRGVRFVLRDIKPPLGMYWKSRIVWSEPLGEAKEGFDCTNIRFEVITEID